MMKQGYRMCHDIAPSLTEVRVKGVTKADNISKAMKAYLQRAKQHDQFLAEQTTEYETGRRHLANIMGVEPESFEQSDIDSAIEYLMPSGLFNKKARPQLKLPSEVFPQTKAVQFGIDGRPFHHMFYTGMPHFYDIMHEAAVKLDELKVVEDEMLWKGHDPTQLDDINTSASIWLSHTELKKLTLENVPKVEYTRFVTLMDRLMSHPLAARHTDFIMSYRIKLQQESLVDGIQPPQKDENGREFSQATGKRKSAEATVCVYSPGCGSFSVNGVDRLYEYFPRYLDRLQIMSPLLFTGHLGRVDTIASVRYGGPSGQAGALRLALSTALCSFVDQGMVERMRLGGLLTNDPRTRERKKPGKEGARRKFAWRKR